MTENPIIRSTQNWVDRFVIQLNLCPFAKAEIKKQTVRFEISDAQTEEQLLQHLQIELNHLQQHPNIETTLLIHPQTLQDFTDFNDFLDICDELLIDMQLDGVYQLASFHPHYQFENTQMEDAENFSNRSPYPMLHILREESLEKAIASHPNIDSIPDRNIETLNKLGASECTRQLKSCFEKE